MAIVPKKASLDNIGGYKVPMPRKSDEEIEDSFMKEVEPSGATPSLPEKIVSSEKTINYDKPKIVTKEQLAAFQKENGADKTLRDYMNAQQGLKRRTNKHEDQGYDASGKLPAPLRSIPQLPNIKFAKGGITSKYMSFTKTGKPDGMKPVMAKGGVTRSSASKRADGCATKGFTKGKNL
jgi:hypothetical protein